MPYAYFFRSYKHILLSLHFCALFLWIFYVCLEDIQPLPETASQFAVKNFLQHKTMLWHTEIGHYGNPFAVKRQLISLITYLDVVPNISPWRRARFKHADSLLITVRCHFPLTNSPISVAKVLQGVTFVNIFIPSLSLWNRMKFEMFSLHALIATVMIL